VTVGELIERLKAFPPTMTVRYDDDEHGPMDIDDVRAGPRGAPPGDQEVLLDTRCRHCELERG
jgi:hypothetical protein